MSWLTVVWSMASATGFSLSLIYLFICIQGRYTRSQLLFVAISAAAGVNALIELAFLNCASPACYVSLARWGHLPISVILVGLVWFVHGLFGTGRRRLAIAISAIWVGCLLLNAFSPFGLLFSEMPELKRIPTWFGASFTMPHEPVANRWRFLGDLASLLILIYVAEASWRLWRQGGRRRAVLVGGSILFFMLAAGVHTPLVDAGIVETPYMICLAFLAIAVAISYDLSTDIVQKEVLAADRLRQDARWQRTMQQIRLAVAELDVEGRIRYTNPFLQELAGRSADELRGLRVHELVPEEESESLDHEFARAAEEGPQPFVERALLCRDGTRRKVRWTSVRLTDADGSVTGFLSMGTDLTDQHQAEGARDEAMHELQLIRESLEEENLILQKELGRPSDRTGIIGESDALRYVLLKIDQVASTDATVLLQGETGVGKDLVARAIHQASARSTQAFIKVNCAALPEHLVESELFGHEKGAFTGADRKRRGRFELADGGTLLLDEVGELPAAVQAKLLHVLQDGEFERVGGGTMRVDVRVIAATNRDLAAGIESGTFRRDLFYRLNVYPITIPPLRQRQRDIPLLVTHFVNESAARMNRSITEIPARVMQSLARYGWPGNVRELQNVVERSVIATTGCVLQAPDFLLKDETTNGRAPTSGTAVSRTLAEVEREHITRVLESVAGRISGDGGAAEILGLNPSTLRFRMKKLDIVRK